MLKAYIQVIPIIARADPLARARLKPKYFHLGTSNVAIKNTLF